MVLASFVILNWRHEHETRSCAESVLRLSGGHEIEIVVVDNESTADSRAGLEDPRWTVVALERNEGFAGGMNAGGRHAQGEFVALLNNDLVLPPDWLDVALAAMTDQAVGIVGGRTEDTTVPRVNARGFTQLRNDEAPKGYVPSVDGSHLFIRRSVWEQLGGFDEDFFAYYDEADLCARTIGLGRRVLYEPALTVAHERGATSDRVPIRRTFWSRRNQIIWVSKSFSDGWLRVVLSLMAQDAVQVVTGTPGARRWSRQDLSGRVGTLWALGWLACRPLWLKRKRAAVIEAGQWSRDYQAGLANG